MSITKELAQYVANASYADLPQDAKDTAKRCLLDWFGVTIGAVPQEIFPILDQYAAETGGEQQATVVGSGRKTSAMMAALVNGTLSHALDLDDLHEASISHPTVTVAPAVLAVGENRRVSGKDLINAFVLGMEAEIRIGLAAGRPHYDKGWHATSTTGRFGAVVGAAKLLGLNVDQLVFALGIAGTQSGGVRQVFGSMCKPFHAGKASADGVLAASLAGLGFTSSKAIVEGKFGFLDIFSPDPKPEKVLEGIGQKYVINETGFKRHASCGGTHSTIDGMLDIRSREKIAAEDVEEIELELSTLCLDAAGQVDPKTGLACKFSVTHCAALAFLEGRAGEDQFTDEKANDPQIVSLRNKVKAKANPGFSLWLEGKVTVVTKDGRRVESHVRIPKGLPGNMFTIEEMEEKFRSLTVQVLRRQQVEELLAKLRNLEEVADVSELMRLCAK